MFRSRNEEFVGIIPARAGFTLVASLNACHFRDHPRSRGVYGAWKIEHDGQPGSSPLARGLRFSKGSTMDKIGIIPARAGFTPTACARSASPTDHPRSRGVYVVLKSDHGYPRGSSPLARGLPIAFHLVSARRGIIPARAGFTGLYRFSRGIVSDHPRSRGVYLTGIAILFLCAGSSPLARGLRTGDQYNRGTEGIIPARAGFTDR